jgi:hypothetical protein
MTVGRRYLGGDQNPGGYRRVFELEDGLEVDENTLIEIERTRVYFDDVLGITYHRQRGVAFLVITGIFALIFIALMGTLYASTGEPAAAAVFGVFAAPFVLAFFLRLLLGIDVITVYGRRTMARMKFFFRKARAREIYQGLSAKIRSRQETLVAARPPLPGRPAPPGPPGPPAPPAAEPGAPRESAAPPPEPPGGSL